MRPKRRNIIHWQISFLKKYCKNVIQLKIINIINNPHISFLFNRKFMKAYLYLKPPVICDPVSTALKCFISKCV